MAERAGAQTTRRTTFTILHTNDLHSNLIGMAPSSDYSPFTLGDDATRGGFARITTLIRDRRAATEGLGPVLVLDAGDFSMGTAFAAATRGTGSELRLPSLGLDDHRSERQVEPEADVLRNPYVWLASGIEAANQCAVARCWDEAAE